MIKYKDIERGHTFFTSFARYRVAHIKPSKVCLNVFERGVASTPENLVKLKIEFGVASNTGNGNISFSPVPSNLHDGQNSQNRVTLIHDEETPVLRGNLYIDENKLTTPYNRIRIALQKAYLSESTVTRDDIIDLIRDIEETAWNTGLNIDVIKNTLERGLQNPESTSYRHLVYYAIKRAHFEKQLILPPRTQLQTPHPEA